MPNHGQRGQGKMRELAARKNYAAQLFHHPLFAVLGHKGNGGGVEAQEQSGSGNHGGRQDRGEDTVIEAALDTCQHHSAAEVWRCPRHTESDDNQRNAAGRARLFGRKKHVVRLGGAPVARSAPGALAGAGPESLLQKRARVLLVPRGDLMGRLTLEMPRNTWAGFLVWLEIASHNAHKGQLRGKCGPCPGLSPPRSSRGSRSGHGWP